MQFGEKLKKLRVSKNMTQKDLAEIINISPQAISRWENNEVEPSLETLRRLAEFFEVSMDDLFGNEKKQEPEEPRQKIPEQKVVLAICEGCNTPIYDKDNIFRFTDQRGQKTVLCKVCQRQKMQKEQEAKRRKAVAELNAGKTRRKRGYLFGALIGGALLLLGVISAIYNKDPVTALVLGISLGSMSVMSASSD